MISDETRDRSEQDMISFFRSIPKELEGSFGLMGGWAVTYLLSKRKIDHVGSRDIDIFYDPNRLSYENVSKTIRHQGFQPHSTFRWIKYVDGRTGREISEDGSKTLDQFNLINIYLDLAAPAQSGNHVLHEPLLQEVFSGKCEYWHSADTRILMPAIDIMVKIKTKSTLQRLDTFKREKDLVDLVAMIRNVQNLWLTEGGVQVQLREDLRTSDTVARALMLDPDAVLAILGRM